LPSAAPKPRNDTEKRRAQVLDFFLLVCRELSFFAEADDKEVMIFLEEALYPDMYDISEEHQISSICMNEQDLNQHILDDIEEAFGQTMSTTQRTGVAGLNSKNNKLATTIPAQASKWIDAH
jgi:ABC-type microcin C transport system permease subunit YejE